MFCIQCEQTLSNDKLTGCQFKKGKCGKEANTADLQDLLIYMVQGISQYAHKARLLDNSAVDPKVDEFILQALFTTLTNVNFDQKRFGQLLHQANIIRDQARHLYLDSCKHRHVSSEVFTGPATFDLAYDIDGLIAQAPIASIKIDDAGEDVFGLRCLILYGLKGCAAYGEHALMLGQTDPALMARFHEYLSFLASKPTDIDALLDIAMKVGELNYHIMALLEQGSTSAFGHPVPTQVKRNPEKGKAILISGHDLADLKALLEQTQGTDIKVYTHGEMLPAHGYPELKAYPHLAGNYGTAWQNQQQEFADFPGPIVMTSNCLIDPNVNGYADRVFTCGPVGWPGVEHIKARDFGPVIAKAESMLGFKDDIIASDNVMVGFGRQAIMSVADQVIDAVKSGDIKHFFLIGGCDGAAPGRNYYSDFAKATPNDTVIMTLGCGKYRFNENDFGSIGGIPRLLDVGQCNDAYAAIQIAVALSEAFECQVNDLPLTLIISWFEQKAAAVLLTLLHLGIRNIHLGPSLPPFLSDNLVNFLVENFELKPTGNAEQDIGNILAA